MNKFCIFLYLSNKRSKVIVFKIFRKNFVRKFCNIFYNKSISFFIPRSYILICRILSKISKIFHNIPQGFHKSWEGMLLVLQRISTWCGFFFVYLSCSYFNVKLKLTLNWFKDKKKLFWKFSKRQFDAKIWSLFWGNCIFIYKITKYWFNNKIYKSFYPFLFVDKSHFDINKIW